MADCNSAGTACSGDGDGNYGSQGTPGHVYGNANNLGDAWPYAIVVGLAAAADWLANNAGDVASAIGNFFSHLFGGGGNPLQAQEARNPFPLSSSTELTPYSSLRPWADNPGNWLVQPGGDTPTDPLDQSNNGSSSRSEAAGGEHVPNGGGGVFGDAPFPIGTNGNGQISITAPTDDNPGDAFIFGFGEIAPDVPKRWPGRWPYFEGAVIAGANTKNGAYLGLMRISGEQVGGLGIHYNEGRGSESTLVLSEWQAESEPLRLQDLTAEFLGGGRYQSGTETGSYTYISFEGVGMGVGLSDPALNVLIRPLAPIGSFRHRQFGYGDDPPY